MSARTGESWRRGGNDVKVANRPTEPIRNAQVAPTCNQARGKTSKVPTHNQDSTRARPRRTSFRVSSLEYRQRAKERKSVRQDIDFSMSYTITARRPPEPTARVQQVCKHGNALDYSRRNYKIDQPETKCQDCLKETWKPSTYRTHDILMQLNTEMIPTGFSSTC